MPYVLRYRPGAPLADDLAPGECCVHRASDAGARWWMLWLCALRETDGAPEVFAVPIAPRGRYDEHGPGGQTWGVEDAGGGAWQVSPSINVRGDAGARVVVAGPAGAGGSVWTQTPRIEGVDPTEPWAAGAAP